MHHQMHRGGPWHDGRVQHQVSHEQILERVHHNLYSVVGEAVDEVKHDEMKWSQSEMVKRIVNYIYKGCKDPDLMSKKWQDVAVGVVTTAMHSYMAACGERPWFYQLRLGHAFTSAVWELLQGSGRPRANFRDVQEFVMQEFESHLDKSLLTKAMWDAISSTFNDHTIRGRLFKAVSATYYTVLDELLADSRPAEEARKVERFTKRWVESAMSRAWTSLENSEQVLTPGNVSRLFQNLIAPFGESHEYSCIPIMFIETIGRPPRNWKFLRMTVQNMFRSWKEGSNGAQTAKRFKKADKSANDDMEVLPAEDTDDGSTGATNTSHAKEEVDADADKDGDFGENNAKDSETGPHPECTSEEDCVGKPSENLVRHMLEGDAGDVYCQSCWESFLSQNATLDGQWEDGENAGEMYTPS